MRNPSIRAAALEILTYCNAKTGKRFGPSTAWPIYLRLEAGADPDECRGVIDVACKQYLLDERLRALLKPSYLFGKAFDELLGELPPPAPSPREPLAPPDEEMMPVPDEFHAMLRGLVDKRPM